MSAIDAYQDQVNAKMGIEGGLPKEVDLMLDDMPHVEYGVDGFTATGLTAIAGEAGFGKTSAIVPIAATVAHLVYQNPDDPLTMLPTLRRKVVYVTEDSGQVNRLLYGLKHHRSTASAEEFREWFHVVDSKRRDPMELAADIKMWREAYGYRAGPELAHHWIEPLIIIDTTSSCLDVESENDNSEASRAIAVIKQELGRTGMAWLVAHVSKALSRGDISALSVRGASAWVGDVNATAYLIKDDNLESKRFLVLGKRRFEPEFTEIEIVSERKQHFVSTPWGQTQSLNYLVCDIKGLGKGNGMNAQAAKAKAEKLTAKIIEVLESAYSNHGDGKWLGLSTNELVSNLSGHSDSLRDFLKELVAKNVILSVKAGDGKTAPTYFWLKGQIRG